MTGTKAEALHLFCTSQGHAFTRFDYRGHGTSGGSFEDLAISDWLDDATRVLDQATEGKQVLVGSSMGGWIALLLALRRPERVRALIGIAAAPDFPTALMEPEFTSDQRATLARDGRLLRPSLYGDPYPITARLIEDGRRHALLGSPIPLACPIRLLQGMEDPDVPWRHALRLVEALAGGDVRLALVKDGDHRLSRPADLALLEETLAPLLREDRG
jgi:pimeloyl-ACP methyl ester carboxylesterase